MEKDMNTTFAINGASAIEGRGGQSLGWRALLAIASGANAVAAFAAKRHRISQDRRKLQEMPDSMLKDIGISRSEIDLKTEFGRHYRQPISR